MDELDFGFQIIEGNKSVLIVAGHNFSHGREGGMKFAEWGTGEIARDLCEKYNFWGIISTKDQMDPNWYTDSPFRDEVKKIVEKGNIGLIVDIHGSGMQNEELVYLRGNKKFKEKYEIEVRNFVKNEQLTIAEELDEKVAVVEIEIREDGRIATIDEDKYREAQEIINGLIKQLCE